MKPLASAVLDRASNGSAQVVVGGALLALAVIEFGSGAIPQAALSAVIFAMFMWAVAYRHVLSGAFGAAAAPGDAEREASRDTVRRAVGFSALVALPMVALTYLAEGGPVPGIFLGNGVSLIVLALLIARRERRMSLRVLFERRFHWRGGLDDPRNFRVEPASRG